MPRDQLGYLIKINPAFHTARTPVIRGIDLGRGLVKRLARQRRFEPPLR